MADKDTQDEVPPADVVVTPPAAVQATPERPGVDSSSATDGDSMEGEEQKGATIKESDIDPTTKAALKDLFGKAKEKDPALTKVKVYSPFRIYYDNVATSVTAVNGTGPFDILPGHKNFLTLLSPGDIVVRSASGKEETISIERGVMHVHSDGVQVFLDV